MNVQTRTIWLLIHECDQLLVHLFLFAFYCSEKFGKLLFEIALFSKTILCFQRSWWFLMSTHTSDCFNARNHTDTMLTRFVVDFESNGVSHTVCVRLYRARKAKFCKYTPVGVFMVRSQTAYTREARISTARDRERMKRVAHAFKTLTQTQANSRLQWENDNTEQQRFIGTPKMKERRIAN